MSSVPTDNEDTIIRQWSCDVCKIAVFDDYDDAKHHEALCGLKDQQKLHYPYRNELQRAIRTENSKKSSLVSICRQIASEPICRQITSEQPLTSMGRERTTKQQPLVSIDHRHMTTKEPLIPSDRHRVSSKKKSKKNKWVCDVCTIAKFVSYVDAFRHEKYCFEISQEQEQKHPGRLPLNSTKSRPVSPSKRQHHWELQPARTKPKRVVKWLCSVCEVVCFEDYDKACRHEDLCAARRRDQDPFANLPEYLDV
jgi:hypothetical protein